ncbi:MMPL family transporter [Tessaracoccus caeni]|uniref:MMPL family transporter n=1 Tax=Tessaracoccus caeni TaxID=3031239 RepID=UPI0023DC3AE3|nr:MMPL family transporter [Tessaracoccus caeni]MDF1487496.1 MMPL family transporter [Tessaracoccus caeni]
MRSAVSASLYALGRWCYRNRGRVVAIWLALLVVLGGLGATLRGSFDDAFEIPGSSSSEAFRRLHMTFPQATALTATAMIVAPEGARADEQKAVIEDAIDDFLAVPTIDEALSPWDEMVEGTVSDDGRAAMMQLNLNIPETPNSDQLAEITVVGDALESQLPDGWQVAMGGQAFNIELPHLTIIEAVGLLVALVVLAVVLGSLVAAGLPLITAIIGVGIAMSLLLLITRVASISSTTPLLAVMLGLAVGIDYALFILSRHRDELRKGADPEESAGRAVGTAGSAVVFAGLTVFIALLGLGVANIPFLTVMGIFAALAVAFAVIIALTMLPALMGYLGERMRPKPKAEKTTKKREGGAFAWWVGVTTKHPIITVVAVVAALGALSLPAAGLRLSLPNSGQHESTAQDRIAYDLVAEHFGPGFNGPLIVTVDILNSDDPIAVIDGIVADIEATDGVAAVPLATPNANVDTGLIQVVPTTAPDDPATQDLANALRDLESHWQETYDVDTAVTGMTAIQNDVSARLGGALLPFGVLVVGLSLVLLAAVFRSVWVPIKATVGYLLSVGAAFGATALVFNQGWFMSLVNLEQPMAVISFLPILLMGILFGLAMDYEVFLVSRMREEYVHGKTALEAVRSGFVASGPVVVAAALIMFAVFAFFVPEGMGPIKQIAFALAVGVAVDAFVIRMTFVPAVLALLGDRAWWLPGWLDRLLPTFDVEGETLSRELELAAWPGDGSVAHADELAVDGVAGPLSLRLMPGNVVGLAGPVGARTGAALALTGRLSATSGRARVAGHLLPGAASRVRRTTEYTDLLLVHDVAAALGRIEGQEGTLVVIDNVEAAATDAELATLMDLVRRTRADKVSALLLCGTTSAHLELFEPDGVVPAPPPEPQDAHQITQPSHEGSNA